MREDECGKRENQSRLCFFFFFKRGQNCFVLTRTCKNRERLLYNMLHILFSFTALWDLCPKAKLGGTSWTLVLFFWRHGRCEPGKLEERSLSLEQSGPICKALNLSLGRDSRKKKKGQRQRERLKGLNAFVLYLFSLNDPLWQLCFSNLISLGHQSCQHQVKASSSPPTPFLKTTGRKLSALFWRNNSRG